MSRAIFPDAFAPALVLSGALLLMAGCSGLGSGGRNDGGAACITEAECPATHTCDQGVCVPKSGGSCGGSLCAGHTFCDTDGQCKGSTQKVCGSDADCGGNFVCPPTAGVCMEPCTFDDACDVGFICNNGVSGCAECAFDTHCLDPLRPLCEAGSGRCVACTAPGQCDDGSHCDDGSVNPQDVNTCQPGCLDAFDCAAGQRCEGASPGTPGACVECTVATERADCVLSGKPYCHPGTRQCVQCTAPGQCPGGEVCNPEGACVACLQDTHCPMGEVCDPNASACVSGCAPPDDNRCPPVSAPEQAVCDAAAGPFGACVECKLTADCSPGNKCSANVCVPGCDASATCPATAPVCNLVADRCVECLRDPDCPTNLSCDTASNTCVCLGVGDQCTTSEQCGNPPFDGFCAAFSRCVAQVECPSTGWRSISNVCGQQCSIVNNQDTCPPSTFCRRVKFVGSTTQNLQCVPSTTCI